MLGSHARMEFGGANQARPGGRSLSFPGPFPLSPIKGLVLTASDLPSINNEVPICRDLIRGSSLVDPDRESVHVTARRRREQDGSQSATLACSQGGGVKAIAHLKTKIDGVACSAVKRDGESARRSRSGGSPESGVEAATDGVGCSYLKHGFDPATGRARLLHIAVGGHSVRRTVTIHSGRRPEGIDCRVALSVNADAAWHARIVESSHAGAWSRESDTFHSIVPTDGAITLAVDPQGGRITRYSEAGSDGTRREASRRVALHNGIRGGGIRGCDIPCEFQRS